jgi:archaellum component FlaG (FlaF/FlaG flagellin family)
MKISQGVQLSVLRRDEATAGSADVVFDVQSDSLLTTLFAEVLTGTLDVAVYAITQGGPADSAPAHEVQLYSFPTISAPSTDLLIQTAAATTARVRVKASWTGACKFDVQARAINGGTAKTQVVTANAVNTDQITINTGTPQVLVPAALVDNIGFQVRNWSSNGAIVYVSETQANAVPARGWPLGPGDVLSISVKGGQTWYASSTVDGADLRILEGK